MNERTSNSSTIPAPIPQRPRVEAVVRAAIEPEKPKLDPDKPKLDPEKEKLPILTCPNCSRRFRRNRPVQRRASCPCPACGKKLWIDPFQKLYPGRTCLTEEQGEYVEYLMRLGDLRCATAMVRDLAEVRRTLPPPSSCPTPYEGYLLRQMMEAAMQRCIDPDEEQTLRELRRGLARFTRRCRRRASGGIRRHLNLRSWMALWKKS